MDADDGQDQASGAQDEAAVGSGQANKADAMQRGCDGRDEDRERQPADDERHAAQVVEDQGELRADSTVVGPQRHDGGGRAELDGDHDRARDDTGTRGDAAVPASGRAAQDVGEIAQEDEKRGEAQHLQGHSRSDARAGDLVGGVPEHLIARRAGRLAEQAVANCVSDQDECDEGGACQGAKAVADGSRHLVPSCEPGTVGQACACNIHRDLSRRHGSRSPDLSRRKKQASGSPRTAEGAPSTVPQVWLAPASFLPNLSRRCLQLLADAPVGPRLPLR